MGSTTYEQFTVLIKAMKSAYTSEKFLPDKGSWEIWYAMLNDIDYNLLSKAIQQYIVSNEYPPTIAALRNIAYDITHKGTNELTELEAWAMVKQAIRNSSYNAETEYSLLPAIVQKAVGSPSQLRNWARDEEFNEGVASSNFGRVFRSIKEREKQDGLLSNNLKLQIDEIANRYRIGS